MATTQLKLYKAALTHCGSRAIDTLTDNVESRRKLDEVWDGGAFVKGCLEDGDWKFATNKVKLDSDPGLAPSFGYSYAFEKPADWVRTCSICSDEFFQTPHTEYDDEAAIWYASIDPIYVAYVSNDPAFGMDYSKWPESFRSYVELKLAERVHKRLTQATTEFETIKKDTAIALRNARNKDAWSKPTGFLPRGGWSRARLGTVGRFYDRKERQ